MMYTNKLSYKVSIGYTEFIFNESSKALTFAQYAALYKVPEEGGSWRNAVTLEILKNETPETGEQEKAAPEEDNDE